MQELVEIRKDRAVCTSLQVAEKFGKRHKDVLKKIESIIADSESAKIRFQKSTYKSPDNNKTYPMYYIDRDGFAFLVMGFTGEKANKWKWEYINAFNKMEKLLSEKQTQAWIDTRYESKLARKAETDVLKQLVEYAKEQGSENANMLYMVYTKLANKAMRIENRDTATITQLNGLNVVEHMILYQIQLGIENGVYYKDIYKKCVQVIEQFKSLTQYDLLLEKGE